MKQRILAFIGILKSVLPFIMVILNVLLPAAVINGMLLA
jgi:hypothetical protein